MVRWLIAVVMLSSVVSGCIVVPEHGHGPVRYYDHPHYEHDHHDHHDWR